MRILALATLMVAAATLVAQDKKDNPVVVKVSGLSATAPADWKSEKPSNNLRSFQFRLPGPDGKPDGEITVMPESDPKAEKVFARWKAQFIPPEDKTVDDISKTSKVEGVKGARIDVLDVAGTWKYKERPFDPKSKEVILEDWRVVWVVVGTDAEATHIRLSGHKDTVAKYYPQFEKWLRELK
jgi:hypothetical protein